MIDEGGLGVADVPLPGEEDEDVAAARGHELIDGVEDAGDLVAVLPVGGPRARIAAAAAAVSRSAVHSVAGPAARGRGGRRRRRSPGRRRRSAPGGRAERVAAGPRRGPDRGVGGRQGVELGVGELARRSGGGRGGWGCGCSRIASGARVRGVGGVIPRDEGAVADLDGVGASRHLDDGGGRPGRGGAEVGFGVRVRVRVCVIAATVAAGAGVCVGVVAGCRSPGDGVSEVVGEARRVDGGGGDDDLQVRAGGEEPGQVAQDEVDVEAPLVGLVDDDRVVAREHRVGLDLRQQDAVGHELDQRGGAGLLREAHLVADHAVPADGGAQLVGDALGDRARGDATRLGVTDHAGDAPAQRQADLGDLRGLSAARLPGDDDDLVVADRLGDLGAAGGDRQLVGVDERGHARGPFCELLGGESRPLTTTSGRSAAGTAGAPAVAATAARAAVGAGCRGRIGIRAGARGVVELARDGG